MEAARGAAGRGVRRGKKLAVLAGLTVIVILVSMAWIFKDEIRSWRRLVRNFDRLGRNAQGYTEYRHTRTGIVFVRLPGGEFTMGSRESETSSWDERPRHRVRLSPFLIAKYEVRQSEWPRRAGPYQGADLPVCDAKWEECQNFCRENDLQLPSEAQWEYAARGGTSTRSAGTGPLKAVAWYSGSGGPRPVGQKKPNGFGLHDVFGNVWEWCEDTYNEAFYSRPEASRLDPVCSTGFSFHVLRGGSWQSPAEWCRAAFRGTGTMPNDQCGLRPVWVMR